MAAAEGFRVKSARMRHEAVDVVRVSCDDRVKRGHGSLLLPPCAWDEYLH